jgi:transcriptional regulator with XRE-family HTH domain
MEYVILSIKFVSMKAEDKKLKQQLASRLYQVRNELGIKQIDLQNEGIISQSHLSKIENGDISVSAVMLYKLAQRYGKELSYFFK